MVGKKGVILLGEHPTETEVATYKKDMGIPEKQEGYVLTPVDGLHKELEITPEVETGFKTMMLKHGIPVKNADGLFTDYLGMLSEGLVKRDEALTAARQVSETALRNEWGQNYETNLNIAKKVVEKFGGENALKAFGDLGDNPEVLKFLSNLGTKISEDSVRGLGDITTTESGALARIKQIEADPDLMDDKSPNRTALLAEKDRLYKIAYPGTPSA